jgi:hypothetical protein
MAEVLVSDQRTVIVNEPSIVELDAVSAIAVINESSRFGSVSIEQTTRDGLVVVERQDEILIEQQGEEVAQISCVGPQGPPGASAGTFFTQQFNSPLDKWEVVHNFGRRPVVEITDLGGCVLWGSIMHLNNNVLQVCFKQPQTGIVTLL